MRYLCTYAFIYLALSDSIIHGNENAEFNNNIHYMEAETGGTLKIQSKGRLSEIIDLDQIPAVKRVLCKGNKILVALKKDEPDVSWKAGQLIIGSDIWRCAHNSLKPESTNIYAKIDSIRRPKNHVVEIHTTAASPLDVFEDADITVHYEQGRLVPSRHRRYLSDPLSSVLNHVDWNASFTSNIPFNQDSEVKTEHVVNVYKNKGKHEPAADVVNGTTYNGKDFLFRCFDCHGYSHISYFFELKVYKVNNKPVVQKYTMEMEINTHVQHNYSLFTEEEITLTKSDVLWRNPPTTIFQTPLAIFKAFPPILLTVNYSSQANIFLKSMTKNASRYDGDFNMDGKTVITQRHNIGKPTENDVTVYNWSVTSSNQHVDTKHTMNATFSLYQNITITPAISWAQKDVDMKLSPPIQVSTRPTINVVSTTDTVTRCDNSFVTVDSNITVAETDFSVDAFGIPIWSITIVNSLSRKLLILHNKLMQRCHADCQASTDVNADVTMETACLEPTAPIVRGDSRFGSLHQLWGDYILFSSEEANASWCGSNIHKCTDCQDYMTGNDIIRACADRLANADLATALTRLAKLAKAEWPDRKILILEAFDEPTSDFPKGRHGNNSVFYEGRGAEVSITKPNAFPGNIKIDDAEHIVKRLGELAVCSKLKYVKSGSASVSMCVEKQYKSAVKKRSLLTRTRRSGHVDHHVVEETLTELGALVRNTLNELGSAPLLSIYESYPPTKSMEQACGAFTGVVSQDDTERFKRLVEYPLQDIQFLPEGNLSDWCGVETRQCRACSNSSGDLDDHWTWCGTRTMSMRMATRLTRLSEISRQQVAVVSALSMKEDSGSSKLYMEGRASKLTVKQGSGLSMENFTSMAILAGFDYVRYTSSNFIEVCVKVQDGLETQVVQMPGANLVAVPLPLGEEQEYDYPDELKSESRKPLLFDVSTSPENIANHFRLSQFVSPEKRYIRLDNIFVNLLDLAYDLYSGGFYIVPGSGYRPRSVNKDNFDTRHEKEKLRYEMGQAAEIKPNNQVNDNSLFDLAMALTKAAKTVRTQRLGIGFGCKPDRLYFELRPMTEDDSKSLEVWDSGNRPLYDRLKKIEDMVSEGGTVLSARADSVICKPPVLGNRYFYFNFDLDELGYCWPNQSNFCSETNEHRFNISQVLQRRLTSAAGAGKLPRADIMPQIEECVINTCGGCPSAGEVWNHKVISCTKMILRYLERASIPFQPLKDKVSVFNTENHESAVHSQACHDGKICVENTQIYSLLMPLITATYSKDNTIEQLFGGADNPSPLLEIVEQELAWRAEGNVDVYIENAKDVNALRNVLKILMAYNQNVTHIDFHIDPATDQDDVIITLQGKVEQWSGSVCPQWSRLVTTPYTIHDIPHERKRRSLERSRDRNQMKQNMKNWEIDWMLKS